MTSPAAPASELLPLPSVGRRFVAHRRVRLGDVDPSGRLRLDATARYLQDVATDDADDADLGDTFGWVVRRSLIDVRVPPTLGETIELTTFCTGSGRSWAERRTRLVGANGGSVEAASLWVQVDAATGRPTALGDRFHEIYGSAAAGRRVSARLTLPGPLATAERRPWARRHVDLDVFGHVNNAVQWSLLEQVMAERSLPRTGRFEVEFLAAVGADDPDLELQVDVRDEPGHSELPGDVQGEVLVWLSSGETVRVAARAIARER